MNPAGLSITLRERSLLETCDLAISFVRRGFGAYALLTALCLVLPGGAFFAVHRLLGLPWLNTWLLVLGWSVLTQGVFTLAGAELLFAPRIQPRRVLVRFTQRLVPYLVALMASRMLLILGASLVLFAPAAFRRAALVPEVVLLEGLRGNAALSRAKRLGGLLSKTLVELGVIVLLAWPLAALLAEVVLASVFEFLLQVKLPVGELFEDGGSLFAILGVLSSTALLATVRLLSYVGGRARTDGWDIQLRFQAILAETGQKR